MKNNTIHKLFAATIAASMSLHVAAQQWAVSMVFTDLNNLGTIDAVIPANDAALNDLLKEHNLKRSDVHLIELNQQNLNWVEKDEKHHKVVVVQENENINGEERTIEIIRVENADDLDKLSDEQREKVEKEIEIAKSEKGTNGKQVIVKKEVKIDRKTTGDEAEDREVEIKVTVEDGKEKIEAYVNGERLSDEEAKALLEEEQVNISTHAKGEDEMMFISTDDNKGNQFSIEKEQCSNTDLSQKKAIVIVKQMETTGTSKPAVKEGHSLQLYPNPATESVTASFKNVQGDYTLSLTDLAGRTIIEEADVAKGPITKKIDLRGVPSGTYVMNLSDASGIHSQRLVIK